MPAFLMELDLEAAGGYRQWNGLLPLEHVAALAGCFGADGQPTPAQGWGEALVNTLKLSGHPLARGKAIVCFQAAGGGYGNPLDRDPELVRRDVWNELVSIAFAADAYGVVIDPATLTVDAGATERRRQALRREGAAPPTAHYRAWPRTLVELDALRARSLGAGRAIPPTAAI